MTNPHIIITTSALQSILGSFISLFWLYNPQLNHFGILSLLSSTLYSATGSSVFSEIKSSDTPTIYTKLLTEKVSD